MRLSVVCRLVVSTMRLAADASRLACGADAPLRAAPLLRAGVLRPCAPPRAAAASLVPTTAALALPAARSRHARALRCAPRLRYWASAAVPDSGDAAVTGAPQQAREAAPPEPIAASAFGYKLVTFYRFTPLADPHAEVARHKAFCQARTAVALCARCPSAGSDAFCRSGAGARHQGPHLAGGRHAAP
jgi:hypothetical protein